MPGLFKESFYECNFNSLFLNLITVADSIKMVYEIYEREVSSEENSSEIEKKIENCMKSFPKTKFKIVKYPNIVRVAKLVGF